MTSEIINNLQNNNHNNYNTFFQLLKLKKKREKKYEDFQERKLNKKCFQEWISVRQKQAQLKQLGYDLYIFFISLFIHQQNFNKI